MLKTMYRMRDRMRSKKGFTLMEMLIVVAIIAILIAIAIPVFSSQLNKAKQAADNANIRAAYAIAKAAELTGVINDDALPATATKYYFLKSGLVEAAEEAPDGAYTLQASNTEQPVPSISTITSAAQGDAIIINYTPATGTDDAKFEVELEPAS